MRPTSFVLRCTACLALASYLSVGSAGATTDVTVSSAPSANPPAEARSEISPEASAPAPETLSVAGVPISGRLFTDFYVPTNNPLNGSLQQISGSLWLQADPKLGENGSAHFVFTANEILTSSVSSYNQFTPGLREGSISYSKLGFDFRAGKMILPWGKSDVINPTDFLTAKNYSFFNPDDEVRRIGSISLFLAWTPNQGNSPFTITVVGTPVFAQTQLLLAPGQIPANISLNTTPQTPTASLANSETALKVAYTGNQWDASLLFFRGWNHTPLFQATAVTGALPNLGVNAIETFQRYKALGGDASFVTGKWVLRAETAYVWTENDDGQSPLLQPSHFDAVAGVERPLGDDFRLQVQGLIRYYPQFLPPSQATGATPVLTYVNQQIALSNALVQNYQDQVRPAATARFAYSNEKDGIEAEIFILANLVGGDYLVRPQFTYACTDALKLIAGLDYRAGPADRPLGALAPYNSVFTEVRYVF
jgi:hypothetical protein